MEYVNSQGAGTMTSAGFEPATKLQSEDLGSIRARFEDQIKRAYSLADRSGYIADQIVGCRPEISADNAKASTDSFSSLVEDLRRALNRIESNLSRV